MGKIQAKQKKTAKKPVTKNNSITNKKKAIAKTKTRDWANYVLFRVMIVGVIVILLSVYFNTGSGKGSGSSSVQGTPQDQGTAEGNVVAEEIPAYDTDYEYGSDISNRNKTF